MATLILDNLVVPDIAYLISKNVHTLNMSSVMDELQNYHLSTFEKSVMYSNEHILRNNNQIEIIKDESSFWTTIVIYINDNEFILFDEFNTSHKLICHAFVENELIKIERLHYESVCLSVLPIIPFQFAMENKFNCHPIFDSEYFSKKSWRNPDLLWNWFCNVKTCDDLFDYIVCV